MNDEIAITRNPTNQSTPDTSPYPTERVDLPSKGYFYASSDPLSGGFVEVKMMTAREEDILTNENLIKKGIVLDKVLESLIVGPPGVNLGTLIVSDKNAIYIAARRLAYGDSYGPLDVQCPSCRTKAQLTINLGEIENKEYDFDKVTQGKNAFTFTLPFSKKTVEYKILTSADEDAIESELKIVAKKLNVSGGAITTRLKKLILSVEGDTSPIKINEFVNSIVSRDSVALRTDVRNNTPEVDLTYGFTCDSCDHEERLDVPMTARFFWPES
jgi:hypothetical protein